MGKFKPNEMAKLLENIDLLEGAVPLLGDSYNLYASRLDYVDPIGGTRLKYSEIRYGGTKHEEGHPLIQGFRYKVRSWVSHDLTDMGMDACDKGIYGHEDLLEDFASRMRNSCGPQEIRAFLTEPSTVWFKGGTVGEGNTCIGVEDAETAKKILANPQVIFYQGDAGNVWGIADADGNYISELENLPFSSRIEVGK